MSFQRELNSKLLNQREENIKHLEYEKEFGFYKAIAAGDIDEVRKSQKEYKESKGYTTSTTRMVFCLRIPCKIPSFTS